MTDNKKPLDIIDPNNLQDGEEFLLDIGYDMFEDKVTRLFKKDNYLVFWCDFYGVFSKKRRQTQETFPLMALPWFIDTIEEQFWNYKPKPTDKPGDVSNSIVIKGETVGINPMRHCCAENLPGYSFWNKNREDYITNIAPQEREIPKYMLKDGLLGEFKRISTALGLKKYT